MNTGDTCPNCGDDELIEVTLVDTIGNTVFENGYFCPSCECLQTGEGVSRV